AGVEEQSGARALDVVHGQPDAVRIEIEITRAAEVEMSAGGHANEPERQAHAYEFSRARIERKHANRAKLGWRAGSLMDDRFVTVGRELDERLLPRELAPRVLKLVFGRLFRDELRIDVLAKDIERGADDRQPEDDERVHKADRHRDPGLLGLRVHYFFVFSSRPRASSAHTTSLSFSHSETAA